MLNKLLKFIREQNMISPSDTVICAVSGGADSVALLFALYLLKDKLDIHLEAAHFNHHLRGEESQRDEDFVKQLCDRRCYSREHLRILQNHPELHCILPPSPRRCSLRDLGP